MKPAGFRIQALSSFIAGPHSRNSLVMLIVCLLTYWPLSAGIFSVKNDAIHYFLPFRFQISEAIRHGEWPLWSPYVYNGFPISGDMQSGAWNPVVWLFSLAGRYDLRMFQFESLLYIFLAGAGMYKLAFRQTGHSLASLLTGIAWMLSGFLLSGQLINWLAAAAFIPFVLHYYTRYLKNGASTDVVKTALALYLLLVAGYPSFFVITAYILITLFLLKLTNRIYTRQPGERNTGRLFAGHIFMAVLFLGLSLPAITAYIDLLPAYQRGNGVSARDAAINAYNWRYLITLLFPAVSGHRFDAGVFTDLNFRNTYIGIFPLLALLIFPPKPNRLNLLLAAGALITFLFSLGNLLPVHQLFHRFIPLFDQFRHPAQMRLFFMAALLLLAAPGIRNWLQYDRKQEKSIRRILRLSALFFFMVLTVLTLKGYWAPAGELLQQNILSRFKSLLHNNDTGFLIVITCTIQMLTVILLYYLHRKQKTMATVIVAAGNLMLLAQPALPLSFVSSASATALNTFINSQPKGFPVQPLYTSLQENSKHQFDQYNERSLNNFYTKQPGISAITNNPSFLAQMEDMLKDTALYNRIAAYPMAFLSEDNPAVTDNMNGKMLIRQMGTAFIKMQTTTTGMQQLILLQNYSPHWQVLIDGKKTTVSKKFTCFMQVSIPEGRHEVVFIYSPDFIKRAIRVMLTMMTVVFLYFSIMCLIKPARTTDA